MTSTHFPSRYAGVRKALLVITMVAVVAGAAFGWWTLQGNSIGVFPVPLALVVSLTLWLR